MSLIVIEVYDALIEAGASEEKAKAAAGAIPRAQGLATKEDLRKLRVRVGLDERLARIDRDLALLKFGYGPVIMALLIKIAFF